MNSASRRAGSRSSACCSRGIGRNFAGLQNSISFLAETRGVGIGRESFARRVHSHVVAITSLLEATADNAAQVMRAVAEARSDTVRRGREPRPDDLVAVTVKSPRTQQKLTMIHPDSGALEPESPSSFVTYCIVPVDRKGSSPTVAAGSEVPIYRLMQPVELDTRVLEGG